MSASSNIYFEPTIDNKNGQYRLSVPQAGIYYYILPSVHSSAYKNFVRCNPFIMYRRCLQKASGLKTKECSRIAQESWEYASEQLKNFFKEYTNEVFSNKSKVYRIVTNNKRKPKRKAAKRLTIDQEVHTQQHLESQVTYEIHLMTHQR
ncbi:hypothetical protein RhiirA4_460591 [Rhizophagus irregularis]|uniref:MATA-HMG n=1 Tax=Rhizophagus irregularis TaxID=588596 RepID=A0A2I1GGY8_9GLOM|nr:hypothetical protein RhiirA4_460591 [Rhizophagus irregularis]